MQLQIKTILLEGYDPEVIIEAVHANHSDLNKRIPENKQNRNDKALIINGNTKMRDTFRKLGKDDRANVNDNIARYQSNTGKKMGDFLNPTERETLSKNPKYWNSAKQ